MQRWIVLDSLSIGRKPRIFMGTIASVSVLSISTYQLHLHGDHTSLLHEVWLTANIKQNLFVSCYIAYVNLSTILSRFSIHFFFMKQCQDSFWEYSFMVLALQQIILMVSLMTITVDYVRWHARLDHIWQDRINKLTKKGLLG